MHTHPLFTTAAVACLAVAGTAGAQDTPAPEKVQSIAEDAYVFAYPMLYNYQTLWTQTQDTTFPDYIGGFGEYRHYARASTPADEDIVTPNNDTTYSWAWLDLRAETIVFETPQLDEGRYAAFQWLDLYIYIIGKPGSRLSGAIAGTYTFAKTDWDGEVPESIDEVYRSESDFIGTLTRTGISGPEDVAQVRLIQRGYRFTPLSS